MLLIDHYISPIGSITIAANEHSLKGVWFDGQKYYLQGIHEAVAEGQNSVAKEAVIWLQDYFSGIKRYPDELPLSPDGTAFRQDVWRLLCSIPYGSTVTYGEIAREIAIAAGKSSISGQAVGGAVGHNPISIIIPCHRVIGADGSLTGYAGGLEKKTWLLQHEGFLRSPDVLR